MADRFGPRGSGQQIQTRLQEALGRMNQQRSRQGLGPYDPASGGGWGQVEQFARSPEEWSRMQGFGTFYPQAPVASAAPMAASPAPVQQPVAPVSRGAGSGMSFSPYGVPGNTGNIVHPPTPTTVEPSPSVGYMVPGNRVSASAASPVRTPEMSVSRPFPVAQSSVQSPVQIGLAGAGPASPSSSSGQVPGAIMGGAAGFAAASDPVALDRMRTISALQQARAERAGMVPQPTAPPLERVGVGGYGGNPQYGYAQPVFDRQDYLQDRPAIPQPVDAQFAMGGNSMNRLVQLQAQQQAQQAMIPQAPGPAFTQSDLSQIPGSGENGSIASFSLTPRASRPGPYVGGAEMLRSKVYEQSPHTGNLRLSRDSEIDFVEPTDEQIAAREAWQERRDASLAQRQANRQAYYQGKYGMRPQPPGVSATNTAAIASAAGGNRSRVKVRSPTVTSQDQDPELQREAFMQDVDRLISMNASDKEVEDAFEGMTDAELRKAQSDFGVPWYLPISYLAGQMGMLPAEGVNIQQRDEMLNRIIDLRQKRRSGKKNDSMTPRASQEKPTTREAIRQSYQDSVRNSMMSGGF